MRTADPIQRASWGLEAGKPLFLPANHPSFNDREVQDPDLSVENVNLRVDWQTLRRLPLSGAVVFSFKALFTPMTRFKEEPCIPSLLLKILNEGKESIMKYKGSYHTEHVVKPTLESYERYQAEQGLVTQGWVPQTLDEYPFYPVPRALPGKRAETPDPKWDGPPYNPKDDGPSYNPNDDGPPHNPKDDGPPYNPKDDGPPYNPEHDGPRVESLAAPNQTTGSAPPTTGSFKVTILADSNRDGKVDTAGSTDLAGKETWTEESGALFLANIVDTDRRCSSQITGSCADNLADIFFLGTTLPEKPVLDPKLAENMPMIDFLWRDWFDGLSEGDKATYNEWEKKNNQYWEDYGKVRNVDNRISACHDSSDDILRNSTYLAPLRTTPNPELSDSAIGSITVADKTAASNVRLFHKTAGQWNFISSNYTFKAEALKAGLELGIDGRDVRRPGGWDGRARVEFKVQDGDKVAKDSVELRVAPVLTQHHGQPLKQLLTATGYAGADQQRFIKELGDLSGKAGLQTPVQVIETSNCNKNDEIWAQDFFEPGYMSIPGSDGPVSIHIMIRSAQDYRSAGRKVFQDLRSNTVGAVQHLAGGVTTDSTGNLETVPPYKHNGKSYPAGRAVMGSAGKRPFMMDFLDAQETQAPIDLDTSWLAVKHTDEFMQFLPVESERGWVMMVNDPLAGLEILQKAQKDGHGGEPAVSRPKSPTDGDNKWRVTNTIDQLLNVTDFASFQKSCAEKIEENVNIIKRETGITDAEIIRMPALFQVYQNEAWQYAGDDEPKPLTDEELQRIFGDIWPQTNGEQRRQATRRAGEQQEQQPAKDGSEKQGSVGWHDILEAGTPPQELKNYQPANETARTLEGRQEQGSGGPAISLYPATINSVVLGNRQILAPNPWGPKIEGQDVLAAGVDAAYQKANYTVLYMDDWFTHHKKVGDVHCGSNAIRELTGVEWW
ncbi:peptidylarginine deiminase [Cordyceps javanica]|uniref:Peptidylarginine deiminase n=1 Tax=Cordyceps javanica TaxID=43265 RepID=A0A545USS5_9HYPO|nr:peptidylarginine deiminase [Cordyceps javanica]TQW04236.1 protein-arginine deiminase [Cordyceps javanica]